MNRKSPCLIFDESANLCDEVDVLASVREVYDLPGLCHELFSALGKNLEPFREFCRLNTEDYANEYRIFRLKKRFGNYLYVFCEKSVISGAFLTMVFPAEDQSEFHRFLSPSSAYFREIPNRIIYEILYIKDRNFYDLTSVSPETFLVISRAPFLIETLLKGTTAARFCDISQITSHTLECIADFPNVSSSEINFIDTTPKDNASLVKLSAEVYAAVLQMALAITSAISDDHKIDVHLSSFGDSAEIEISTSTNRLDTAAELMDISALECKLNPLGGYAKIASIISNIADILTNISFDPVSHKLSVVIASGFEKPAVPDFKFSDPTEHIDRISSEMLVLLGEIK